MDYARCFELYLENEQKAIKVTNNFSEIYNFKNILKKKIFVWLEEVLQRREEIPKFHEIHYLMIKRIKELVNCIED